MRVFCFLIAIASASAQIERPSLGLMVDRDDAARPVYGVAGSATLGDAVASGAVVSGCSKRLCLVKTESSVISSTGETVDAPTGAAIIAPPFLYFEGSRQLARWHDGQLDPIDVTVEGEVLSLRVAEDGAAEFAVRRSHRVWIVRGDGAVVGSLPDAAGAAMLLHHGVIFARQEGVILRRADGSEIRFDIAGAERFFALGDGYVGVRAGSATWAIRLDPGVAFLLPGAAQ